MLVSLIIIWIAALLFFYKYKIWIFYYIWGSVGCTILLILLLRGSFVEFYMESLTGVILDIVLNFLKIQSQVFDNAPGTILVLLAVGKTWTTIVIDIECSGVLESCVFLGLLIFYPGFSRSKKMLYLFFGMAGIFFINLIRLTVIVAIMNSFGRDSIYLAHTLIGRLVFFGFLIILYWFVFTRSSLVKIKEHKDA